MKQLFAWLAIAGALCVAVPAFAQDKTAAPGAAPAVTAPVAAPGAGVAARAPTATTPAPATAAPAPKLDSGDTAWMLTSTTLVILMTIPGLALFYGGLVRSKNMLSVL
ncbi:MAG: ammonia channel protein, partial [Casimicrobiaceae bacterium]